jgi:hypothetical protein
MCPNVENHVHCCKTSTKHGKITFFLIIPFVHLSYFVSSSFDFLQFISSYSYSNNSCPVGFVFSPQIPIFYIYASITQTLQESTNLRGIPTKDPAPG